jgi:glycosyltransferase involved in cell wall biosynthesis
VVLWGRGTGVAYRGLTVSVVIPCYNEEDGIRYVLERIPAYVDEVIVVDNNCTDRTASVAAALGARIVVERRKGYGYAYQGGFPHARGDIIATVDGDGTYPASAIAPLIDHMEDMGADFVSANRFPLDDPEAMHARNQFGNHVLTLATRLLFRTRIADSQSGMWVFRRRCLDVMRPVAGGMAFSEEIKLEAITAPEVRFAEHHIQYAPRIGKTKLFTFRDGIGNLVYLVRRRIAPRRSPEVLPAIVLPEAE